MSESKTLKDLLKPLFTHRGDYLDIYDQQEKILSNLDCSAYEDLLPIRQQWEFHRDFLDFLVDALNEKSARDFGEHKRWIKVKDSWGEYHYECPYCEDAFYFEEGGPRENNFNFCHNCGKRLLMPEEEKC